VGPDLVRRFRIVSTKLLKLRGKKILLINLRMINILRKSQEEREIAMKTLRGDKKKRKVLDDLLEQEVAAKKKRIAELDENFEKGTKMKTVMTHNLMQRLRC